MHFKYEALMSLNHAPLQTTLDCRGEWNLKMNNYKSEVSI
jgi:hypothetical protein